MEKKRYFISMDSELGKKLGVYFDQCSKSYQATRDAMKVLHEEYALPEMDDTTSYVTPTDSEAGGLIAISLPQTKLANVIEQKILRELWDYVSDAEVPGNNLFFPRIYVDMHYVRLSDARKLAKKRDWKFAMDGEGIKTFLYKDVKLSMTTKDRKYLTPAGSIAINPNVKLALGKHYKFSGIEEDPSLNNVDDETFAKAVSLYEYIQSIPIVPSGTLAKVLGLKSSRLNPSREEMIEETNLSYTIDEKRKIYVVETGLVSDDPDFRSF